MLVLACDFSSAARALPTSSITPATPTPLAAPTRTSAPPTLPVTVPLTPVISPNFATDRHARLARLHQAPHSKMAIAYIDIGQAENYRSYWQSDWRVGKPDWIAGGDPDGWAGNFLAPFP